MKVKELIEKLSQEDPDAIVVCSGPGPVYFADGLPGYYDGHTPVLIHDEKKKPYYSIIGYKWDSSQPKVVLQAMNLEDCLYNCFTTKQVDDFIVQGHSRYVESALELKEKVKQDFKAWDKE